MAEGESRTKPTVLREGEDLSSVSPDANLTLEGAFQQVKEAS